jgi:hypothetical protein
MAHFCGAVSGRGRTSASRVGRKTTGLQTVAASWQGAVKSDSTNATALTVHSLNDAVAWGWARCRCGSAGSRALHGRRYCFRYPPGINASRQLAEPLKAERKFR